ncbi:MAG: MFS transporter, partial [Brevibacterium aurantiacum]|nr:MFS transporter [Brevibacterium aurantiacum]
MSATPATPTTQPKQSGKTTSMQKKVLVGGSIGQFVEFYDFTLYGLSAVILSEYFFPDGDRVTGLLVIFATFGVAFVMRPLGGLFFGALGDKVGRRKTLTVTIFLVGICTALIGILPGFDQIGWFAPILLILARLGQGFSAGGESVGGPSFVYEHAPVGKRGLWINITLAATALPSVFAGGLILLLSTVMSDASFDSWGWRIPFLLALPLSAVGLWIRSRTDESELFKKTAAERPKEFSPIRDSFRENSVGMLQVFFVLGLTALGFYMLSAYFVTYIQTTGDLTREQSLLTNAIAMASYTIFLPIAGAIGDRVGRKPMLIAGSILLAITSIPAFGLVTSGNMGLAFLGQTIFVISLCCYGGG